MLGLEFGSLARRSTLGAIVRKSPAEFDLHAVARWLALFVSMFCLSAVFALSAVSTPCHLHAW